MKKILAFDFDGTVIKTGEADKAHQDWFNVMAYLLKSPKVRKLAGNKDYFKDVFQVLEKFTGLKQDNPFDRKVMTIYARNLFQMLYLARIKKAGKEALHEDMVDILVDYKPRYDIALITTAPEDSVGPALSLLNIKDLFDYIYKSPIDRQPEKSELMAKFIKERGKPLLYMGNSVEDGRACKEHDIKFILCMWGKFDEEAKAYAHYKIKKPEELRSIINIES